MKYWIVSPTNLKGIEVPEEGDVAVLIHVAKPRVFQFIDDRWRAADEDLKDEILDELAVMDDLWVSRFPNDHPDRKYYYSTLADERARRKAKKNSLVLV